MIIKSLFAEGIVKLFIMFFFIKLEIKYKKYENEIKIVINNNLIYDCLKCFKRRRTTQLRTNIYIFGLCCRESNINL